MEKRGGDNECNGLPTAGKNTNDPTWDGTLCWEEIKNAGSSTFYFIELRDTPNGPSLSQFPITLAAKIRRSEILFYPSFKWNLLYRRYERYV